MTVEVVPRAARSGNKELGSLPMLTASSHRWKMGPRSIFRWILVAGCACLVGWYCVSRSLGSSMLLLAESTPRNPVLKNLAQEIEARKLRAGEAINLFPVDPEAIKSVLFWTVFFGAPDGRASLGPRLFEGCPVHQCSATGDRSLVDTSSAVIFHVLDIDPDNLPGPRRPGQHYVFLIGESPTNAAGRIPRTPDGFFDMTFSYRLDSDVLGHYGYSVPVEQEPLRNFAKGKQKLVAWFVSNCKTPSKRENYVKELQKYITVDVYGKCGPLKCPREDEDSCNAMLKNDYKFYLSFENSVCQDYVTEKFTNALRNNVVPVVLGNGNMTIFPPHSFIHVDQYPSVKALAEYLHFLDKNDTAYNEYMNWRFDRNLVESNGKFSSVSSSWCMLCEHLHDPSYQAPGYPDARKWFTEGGHCRSGTWS